MSRAAVLFDVGNTLIHLDYARMAGIVGRVAGRPVSPPALLEAGYVGRRAVEEALANGRFSDAGGHEVFLRALLAAVGVEDDLLAATLGALEDEHRCRHLYSVVPPGTRETLQHLAALGYVVGAISNSDGTVDQLLAAQGLRQHLAFVIDSGRVGIEKPDRRIFALGLEAAGVSADRAWYVGDFYAIDVVGAEAVGMRAVLLDPLGRYGHLGCRTVNRVSALPALLAPA